MPSAILRQQKFFNRSGTRRQRSDRVSTECWARYCWCQGATLFQHEQPDPRSTLKLSQAGMGKFALPFYPGQDATRRLHCNRQFPLGSSNPPWNIAPTSPVPSSRNSPSCSSSFSCERKDRSLQPLSPCACSNCACHAPSRAEARARSSVNRTRWLRGTDAALACSLPRPRHCCIGCGWLKHPRSYHSEEGGDARAVEGGGTRATVLRSGG